MQNRFFVLIVGLIGALLLWGCGNSSSNDDGFEGATDTPAPDTPAPGTTAPSISTFAIGDVITVDNVTLVLEASDASGVNGYLITLDNSTQPSTSDSRWVSFNGTRTATVVSLLSTLQQTAANAQTKKYTARILVKDTLGNINSSNTKYLYLYPNANLLDNFTSIDVGSFHTCGILADKSVKCWGSNYSSQLGNRVKYKTKVPAILSYIDNATSVSVNGNDSWADAFSCAALSSGEIKCWGHNGYGQLGNGTTSSSGSPVTVTGISNASTVVTGDRHSCTLLSNGEIECWGDNSYGQLGDGTKVSRKTPVDVTGISTAIDVSAGAFHTCAALSSGSVQCWGYNSVGQLGNGTTTNQNSPVAVSNITDVLKISVGGEHTCVVTQTGLPMCWGSNGSGRLGDGTSTNRSTPVQVSGLTNIIGISAGTSSTCALLSDKTLSCWGSNGSGQLGDGTQTSTNTPVTVSGIANAIGVSTSGDTNSYHRTCAILSDGFAKCWGKNQYGYSGLLGDSTTTTRLTPSNVHNDSFAFDIGTDAGNYFKIEYVPNSTLTVKRGGTYSFTNPRASGNSFFDSSEHPFILSTTPGVGSGATAYTSGVADDLADSGVLTWEIPSNALSILYYGCSKHSGMGGMIQVVGY